jgi:hypothetical protein
MIRKVAAPLPEDWEPSDWWKQQDMGEHFIASELERFREYWHMERPEITRKSWERTWREWIRKTETYKNRHKADVIGPIFVSRDDPRYAEFRARAEGLGKNTPQGGIGWFFPREWVNEGG